MLTDVIISLGMTRAAFAEALGISRAYLSGLESGKKKPSLDLAVKIDRLTSGGLPVASWVNSSAGTNANQVTLHHQTSEDAA